MFLTNIIGGVLRNMGYEQDSQELIKLTSQLSTEQRVLVLNLAKYLLYKKERDENDKGDAKCL
ncbi:hypothetical protein AN1V17_00750 [Vallitalea sediminicola]